MMKRFVFSGSCEQRIALRCVHVCMRIRNDPRQYQPDILHPYTSKRSAMPVSQVTGRIRTKRVSVALGSIVLATSVGLVLP